MTFTDETVQRVWEKGHKIPGDDPNTWRKDDCHATMKRTEHGNRLSKHGWEIDHIDANGGDGLSNLRPLQWENNVATSDGRLSCVVTS